MRDPAPGLNAEMAAAMTSWQFRLVSAVYLAGLVGGLVVRAGSPSVAPQTSTRWIPIAVYLLARNSAVEIAIVAGGALTFGVWALGALALNGVLIGATWRAGLDNGLAAEVFKGLCLHFIPESLALLLAGYLGLRLSGVLLSSICDAQWISRYPVRPAHVTRILGVMAALTVLSAVIEALASVYLL